MKRILGLLASLVFLAAPIAALAAPIPYYNQPFSSVQDAVNSGIILPLNQTMPFAQPTVACSGTTTATCQGLKLAVSVTGLSTAAGGVSSAAMTVTDASVTASSVILCNTNGYAGTGNPITALIVPGAGSFTFVVTNVASSGALNATVVNDCMVFN